MHRTETARWAAAEVKAQPATMVAAHRVVYLGAEIVEAKAVEAAMEAEQAAASEAEAQVAGEAGDAEAVATAED